MSLEIKQRAVEKDAGWWNWSVWIDGPRQELDQIEHVEYVLHPTYSPPVRSISSRRNKFRLRARGWGEFLISARLYMKNGKIDKLEHWLELDSESDLEEQDHAGEVAQRSIRLSDERPRLYLSSGLADMKFAYALKDALEEEGFEVVIGPEYEQPLEVVLERGHTNIQAALFMISDIRNPWLKRDYLAMRYSDIETLTVQIGEAHELPDELQELPHFKLKDLSKAHEVAADIARKIGGI